MTEEFAGDRESGTGFDATAQELPPAAGQSPVAQSLSTVPQPTDGRGHSTTRRRHLLHSLEHTYRSLTPRMQELLAGLTGIHSGKGVVAVNAAHKHLGGSLPGSTTSVT